MRKTFLLFIFLSLVHFANAQEKTTVVPKDTTDLSNLSIEELSLMKSRYVATDMEKTISLAIEAASRKPLSLRKSPSIVSVITQEEIERSGARDLIDVLKMVPGIEFNVDVEGVVAISFRGLWANEGNILLQIDGQEINETAYASLQFGNHYDVNQIKKIEIIRGPGSAIYGGCAEYAVINIITKKGEDLKGVNAHILLGQTDKTYARQNVAFSVGNKVKELSYSVAGMIGRGQRSDQRYTDIFGNTIDMVGNSDLKPNNFNIHLSYKGLSLLFMYDYYATNTRDGYVNSLSRSYACNFLSLMSEIKYSKQLNRKVQFEGKFSHKQCEPWTFNGEPDMPDTSYGNYKILTNRYRLNLSAIWDPIYWLNANIGFEGYYDRGSKSDGHLFREDSCEYVNYYNYAPFAQLLIKTQIANFTAGARYDVSTAFGSAFNPRLGITKKVGLVNFKLLYASSFRAPAIENIQYAITRGSIKPERSHTIEFETSFKLGKEMYLSVNLFDITTQNAIRYFVRRDTITSGDPDGYRNTSEKIGSQGIELEYKYKSGFGFINFVYSHYTVVNKEVDFLNAVSMNRSATLGTARNKFTLTSSINVGKKFFVTPSLNFLGTRYAYTSLDSSGDALLCKFEPQTYFNLYLGSDKLLRNVSFGLGVSNITNEKVLYVQAYNSMHAPLPGLGREYYLKFNYNFSFDKIREKKK